MSCLFSEVRSRLSPGLCSSSSVLSIWSSSPTSLSASSVWSSAGQFGSFFTGRSFLEKLASRSSSELLGWGLSLGFLRLRLAKMEVRSSSLLYWSLPDPQEPCYRTKHIKTSVSLQRNVINLRELSSEAGIIPFCIQQFCNALNKRKHSPLIWQSHWWLNLVEQGEKNVSRLFQVEYSRDKEPETRGDWNINILHHNSSGTAQTVESCRDLRDEGDTHKPSHREKWRKEKWVMTRTRQWAVRQEAAHAHIHTDRQPVHS